MAILFKCKMCGGNLEIDGEQKVGTCTYCGSQQTLPRLDDDERTNLYERAGHFRRNNEYDKALRIYERLLETDGSDPEAHWSVLLCKYGVEYVEDPRAHTRHITCNRTQSRSILADVDYHAALESADISAQSLYEQEAKEIDRIQKEALAIAGNEEPFDIFLCYKETGADGRRTKDSVRAQEIYKALTDEGYKVFFARVTLEDKAGTAYEPYIFAALSSAKVLVAVGTSQDNLNAVWVKNEWSRFLSLMVEDPSKKLVPVYEDMDAYDLPDDFSMFQALNMGNLGFIQDLVRGVGKFFNSAAGAAGVAAMGNAPVTVAAASSASAAAPLVKRALLCCEDGDFAKADELVEQALNLDPENAEIYLVSLMTERQCRIEDQLGLLVWDGMAQNAKYQKVIRFGNDDIKSKVENFNAQALKNFEDKQRREAEQKAAAKRLEGILNSDIVDEEAVKQKQAETKTVVENLNSQLQQLKARVTGLSNREQQVRREHGSLGLFAGSQKRELEAQLTQIQSQRQTTESQINNITTQINTLKSSGAAKPDANSPQWIILHLDTDNNRALAIAKDIVMRKRFDEKSNNWQYSEIRRWLNGEFYGSLSDTIKSRMLDTHNKNVGTTDRVFLLSAGEAIRYFRDENDRIATYNGKAHQWWLRSPGSIGANRAAYVDLDGSVNAGGYFVSDDHGGVRPAFWFYL